MIKHSPYVVACNVGGTIYLNPSLEDYPILYERILEHEKEHTDGYSSHDFFLDLKNSHLKGLKKDYYKFILKNPKSLIGFSPIMKLDNNIVFDINLMITYTLGITLGIAISLLITGG